MDLRKVKKLIELVEESGISELEVKSGDEAVRISMNVGAGSVSGHVVGPVAGHITGAAAAPETLGAAATPAGPAAGQALRAPLAGTFYVAASPDAAPFVVVGNQVSKGQPVCIIESMKMMNTIEADRSGVVRECLVDNGEPVAAGQALFMIG